MLPPLLKSYDAMKAAGANVSVLAEQIAVLREWDFRWAANSIATSLAVYRGDDLEAAVASKARAAGTSAETYAVEHATDAERISSLGAASKKLERDFGT